MKKKESNKIASTISQVALEATPGLLLNFPRVDVEETGHVLIITRRVI